MVTPLRPYQRELLARVGATWRAGARAVVLQLGTGGGKTHTAAWALGRFAAVGKRAIFVAPLDSLVSDTHARLLAEGTLAGYVQAGRPRCPELPVQVCSLQTLVRRGETPPAELVILDECHGATAEGVRAVLARYEGARLLGLTATPQRGDGDPLSEAGFEALVCGPTNAELTRDGYLVPCDVLAPAAPLERLTWDPVLALEDHAPGGRAIVFCGALAEAREHAERLGDRARVVSGSTPRAEREEARRWLVEAPGRSLWGCDVFRVGWDCPAVDTVVLADAFGTVGAFLQAIGRGLRPSPSTGKIRCTVLDLRGAVHLHGLPDEDRIWSITGEAVRRTEPGLALSRCGECLATFRTAATCPRCGAKVTAREKVRRTLTRAEKLARVEAMPPEERERRYLAGLLRVATARMGMPAHRAEAWAKKRLISKLGRSPAWLS